MNSLDFVQDELLKHLRSSIPQRVDEGAIPDGEYFTRNEYGDGEPYVVVQFGDIQFQGTRNMATAQAHDYSLPVYCGIVAPQATAVRRIMNLVNVSMLGFSCDYSGQVEKRAGGMMFILPAQHGFAELFVAPASFGIAVQVSEEV